MRWMGLRLMSWHVGKSGGHRTGTQARSPSKEPDDRLSGPGGAAETEARPAAEDHNVSLCEQAGCAAPMIEHARHLE